MDVFAYRWESTDGKKGYTPVCELEWQKPLIKCSACPHIKLSPLTDQVLYSHLMEKRQWAIPSSSR